MDEISALRNEIKDLRSEVAEHKTLLHSILSAIKRGSAITTQIQPEVTYQDPGLLSGRDLTPQELAREDARGNPAPRHAMLKRLNAARKKKQSIKECTAIKKGEAT